METESKMSERCDEGRGSLSDDAHTSEGSELREAWRALVDRELPAAAAQLQWPFTEHHCFARILLDNAFARPWREVVPPPAWRNTPMETLQKAVDLGRAVLEGREDIDQLNETSLRLRGKMRPGPVRRRFLRHRRGASEKKQDGKET